MFCGTLRAAKVKEFAFTKRKQDEKRGEDREKERGRGGQDNRGTRTENKKQGKEGQRLIGSGIRGVTPGKRHAAERGNHVEEGNKAERNQR